MTVQVKSSAATNSVETSPIGSISSSTPITRDILLEGYAYGTHRIGSNEAPLSGFKKVRCVIGYKFYGRTNNDKRTLASSFRSFLSGSTQLTLFKSTESQEIEEQCIAKIEILPGSTIIRPYTKDPYSDTKIASNKLRTNSYRICDITPISTCDEPCAREVISASSLKNPDYSYEKNKTYNETLDEREDTQCTNGLHFFLKEHSARNYIL